MKIQYFYLVTLTNLIYHGTLRPHHNLTQVISESTCRHGSLLDLVITNILDAIQNYIITLT